MCTDPLATIQDLIELIEAIERRSPQLQRNGEAAIVDTARRLGIQARARIRELEVLARGAVKQ